MNSSLTPQEIISWFKKYPPVSTDGQVQLATAMLAIGKPEKAHAMIRYIWLNGNFGGKKKEQRFYRRHKKLLSKEDHIKRLDRLLWQARSSALFNA